MLVACNEPVAFGRSSTAKSLNRVGIDFLEGGEEYRMGASVAKLDIQLPFARQDIVFELSLTRSSFLISLVPIDHPGLPRGLVGGGEERRSTAPLDQRRCYAAASAVRAMPLSM